MTKYNKFMKQNCFVVNISVFWLNKAVLTINNFTGQSPNFEKSLMFSKEKEKNLFCN